MKKFFEKYDLLKVSGILVLVAVVMTWAFQGTDIIGEEVTRVGLSTFFIQGVLGTLSNFAVLIAFLFITGGFYQVLSKRAGYQKLVKTIGEKLKGFEIPVVLSIMLIFAILTSLMNEYFPLLALVPFFIAILSRLKVDKITAFTSTFGGMLIGAMGSTFSTKVVTPLTQYVGVKVEDILTTQTIIFVITFVALGVFTIIRLVKAKKDKKDKKFEEYDLFIEEVSEKKSKESKKVRMWPYATMMILLIVTVALAYLPWSTWKVEFFTELTKKVNEFTIFGQPIISYIIGTFVEFGSWEIYTTQNVMLIAILLIKIFGKVPLDEIFESFGKSFTKMGKTVLVMMMVYFIVEIAVLFPVIPGIAQWLAGLTEGFNAFTTSLGTFLTSLFGGEMEYVARLVGPVYTQIYTDIQPTLAIIFQSIFGFVSFFVPSSVILMMGLSYLDIKYKDWLKFIWKFLLVMLVAIVIIIAVIA